MKFFLAITLLFCSNLFPQETDTIQSLTTDTLNAIFDSSFIQRDTIIADTTWGSIKDTVVFADTLYPLYQTPLYEKSFFIGRETIDILDYRYPADFFSPAGVSFLKDKGMIGQPNDLILYGSGFGKTAFYSDGILFNNRYTGLLDLNLIQSESIDSIEILPLPRGYLYGPDNYLTAVNLIEKDFITPAPYTRIKYYEGPDGEAFVDGIFNSSFLSRFNIFLDVSNRKYDGLYDNSDFSIWQANTKLKYFLSNSINIIGSYSLVSSDLGFFGGVDVDSINNITNDINSILYDPSLAPVVYPTLRQESKWDKLKIRGLGKFGNFNTDLNFYYHSEQEKYTGIPSNNEIKNYISGASIRQSYSTSLTKFEINGVFEKRELNYYLIDTVTGFQREKIDYNVLSLSPVLSLYFVDSMIIPSFFIKIADYSHLNNTQKGFGTDISFRVFNFLSLYGGISRFDLLYGIETDIYELGAKIKLSQLFIDIKYFDRKNTIPPFMPSPYTLFPFIKPQQIRDISGFGTYLNYDFWKINFEGRFSYNTFEGNPEPTASEIRLHFNTGIFYKDILFNENLDLKTGFVFKYYDFESSNYTSANQIDFTVSGIIQKTAIVYFSWENLLDNEYFIVPYYPMRERGIRFGLAWELFN